MGESIMAVFQIRWQEVVAGAFTTLTLVPMPTAVEYPETRNYVTRLGPDGGIVTQRPMRDNRPRKWIWTGYRNTVPGYSTLWTTLQLLDYRARLQVSKPPLIGIWEDATLTGGFNRLDVALARVFTPVRFLQVSRTMAAGGGSTYESSRVEFIIDDLTYTGF